MSPSAKGLRLSAAFVIGFGLFMLLSAAPPLRGVVSSLADLILWPLDGGQTAQDPVAGLLGAICGGLAVGWGVLVWELATRLHATDPEGVRRLVLRSYMAWFLADGAASVMAGAPLNLVGNALFLIALWWPIRKTAAAEPVARH